MPLILAVDTTSEYGSLALVRDGELLEEALLHAPASFSPVLYEELARLLKRHGVELAEVSNLQAVARYGTARLRGVALDARRSEIYGAVYDDAGKLVTEEVVAKFGPWLETLPDGVEEFLSNDLTVTLEGTRFAGARVVMAPRQLAGAIGRIAGERLARGEASDAAALDANYVRRTDAELALKV